MVSLSGIAPDQETLNPVFFLLCVYFWNMVFLDREKLIFWTFSVLVEYALRRKAAELFGRFTPADRRGLQSGGAVYLRGGVLRLWSMPVSIQKKGHAELLPN